VVQSGRSKRIDNRVAELGKNYEVYAWRSGTGRFAVVFKDITDRKCAESLNEALNSVNQIVHSSLDFDEIMQKIVLESSRAIGSETAAISLRKGEKWIVSYKAGFSDNVIGEQMNDEEEQHAVLAIKTKKPVIIDDAFNDERVNIEHMRNGVFVPSWLFLYASGMKL